VHPARISAVEQAFVDCCNDFGMEVQLVAAADWYLHLDRQPNGMYGWLYPSPVDEALAGAGGGYDDPKMLVVACPQLIAKQTEMLSGDEFRLYVNSLLWMCVRFVQLWAKDYNASTLALTDNFADLTTAVESDLYDQDPDALQVLSTVQLSAIFDNP
jgi:hypothetical protein